MENYKRGSHTVWDCYFHIDIAEVRTEEGKLYMFVAIDRASKFAFVELHDRATRRNASEFLRRLIKAVTYKVHTVLTDNGVQFSHMPHHRDGPTARYSVHMFDRTVRLRPGPSCLKGKGQISSQYE